MSNPNPSPETRFKAGATANPGGKPVHARNRVTKAFLEALAEDFTSHGAEAIVATREQHPDRYIAIVASLLPKEFVIEKPLDGLSDEELASTLAQLRDLAGRLDAARGGDSTETQH